MKIEMPVIFSCDSSSISRNVCLSVCRSVCRSVGLSVRRSVGLSTEKKIPFFSLFCLLLLWADIDFLLNDVEEEKDEEKEEEENEE